MGTQAIVLFNDKEEAYQEYEQLLVHPNTQYVILKKDERILGQYTNKKYALRSRNRR
jgi:hypothetical protein